NPYFRAAQPEVWVAAIRSGSNDYDIQYATISGCKPLALSDFTPLSGPVSSPANEFYPAISPDGKTLYFTRCPSGVCGIFVTHRDSTAVAFPDGQPVAGLRVGAPPGSIDLHAQPVWV